MGRTMKMQAKLIDGKAVSAALREQLKEEVAALAEDGITPGSPW